MFLRPENKQLPVEIKSAIITLHNDRKSIKSIAERFDISRSTVRYWIQRFEETGDIKRQNGSGRPRVTNPLQDLRIHQAIRRKPINTAGNVIGK